MTINTEILNNNFISNSLDHSVKDDIRSNRVTPALKKTLETTVHSTDKKQLLSQAIDHNAFIVLGQMIKAGWGQELDVNHIRRALDRDNPQMTLQLTKHYLRHAPESADLPGQIWESLYETALEKKFLGPAEAFLEQFPQASPLLNQEEHSRLLQEMTLSPSFYRKLLNAGMDIAWFNQRDSQGVTPIHKIARQGDVALVRDIVPAFFLEDVALHPAFTEQDLALCFKSDGAKKLQEKGPAFLDQPDTLIGQINCEMIAHSADGLERFPGVEMREAREIATSSKQALTVIPKYQFDNRFNDKMPNQTPTEPPAPTPPISLTPLFEIASDATTSAGRSAMQGTMTLRNASISGARGTTSVASSSAPGYTSAAAKQTTSVSSDLTSQTTTFSTQQAGQHAKNNTATLQTASHPTTTAARFTYNHPEKATSSLRWAASQQRHATTTVQWAATHPEQATWTTGKIYDHKETATSTLRTASHQATNTLYAGKTTLRTASHQATNTLYAGKTTLRTASHQATNTLHAGKTTLRTAPHQATNTLHAGKTTLRTAPHQATNTLHAGKTTLKQTESTTASLQSSPPPFASNAPEPAPSFPFNVPRPPEDLPQNTVPKEPPPQPNPTPSTPPGPPLFESIADKAQSLQASLPQIPDSRPATTAGAQSLRASFQQIPDPRPATTAGAQSLHASFEQIPDPRPATTAGAQSLHASFQQTPDPRPTTTAGAQSLRAGFQQMPDFREHTTAGYRASASAREMTTAQAERLKTASEKINVREGLEATTASASADLESTAAAGNATTVGSRTLHSRLFNQTEEMVLNRDLNFPHPPREKRNTKATLQMPRFNANSSSNRPPAPESVSQGSRTPHFEGDFAPDAPHERNIPFNLIVQGGHAFFQTLDPQTQELQNNGFYPNRDLSWDEIALNRPVPCEIRYEDHFPALAEQRLDPRVNFLLTSAQNEQVRQMLRETQEDCRTGDRSFTVLNGNCLDYSDQVSQRLGLPSLASVFEPVQLTRQVRGLDSSLAIQYALMKTHGFGTLLGAHTTTRIGDAERALYATTGVSTAQIINSLTVALLTHKIMAQIARHIVDSLFSSPPAAEETRALRQDLAALRHKMEVHADEIDEYFQQANDLAVDEGQEIDLAQVAEFRRALAERSGQWINMQFDYTDLEAASHSPVTRRSRERTEELTRNVAVLNREFDTFFDSLAPLRDHLNQ